ncbi:MAG: LUD domain-containing protein, partial [Chloroflexi bacterium]|nr:LUD domain-containing protein [Chloroflexota bacterium]
MSSFLNTPDAVRDWHAGLLVAATVAALTHNGMPARYVATRAEARELILGEIPRGAGVGLGGSMTARELDLAAGLLERGCRILNERLS